MTRRNLFGIALAAALAAAGCDGTAQTAPEAKPRGVPVRTVTVEQRDLQDEVVLHGHPEAAGPGAGRSRGRGAASSRSAATKAPAPARAKSWPSSTPPTSA